LARTREDPDASDRDRVPVGAPRRAAGWLTTAGFRVLECHLFTPVFLYKLKLIASKSLWKLCAACHYGHRSKQGPRSGFYRIMASVTLMMN
jgi:hypothetical protein